MNILRKMKCMVFGHSFRTHQAFTPISRRVLCGFCGGDWAMHDEVRALVPWSSEFAQLYKLFGHEIKPIEKVQP